MIKRLGDISGEKYAVKYSHRYPKNEPWWEKPPVALLIRDPRDVIVSHFFQITKRRKKECPENISDFIRDPKWGIDNVVHFYNEWYEVYPNISQCMLLRYEDLQKDCHSEFKRLLEFFAIEVEETFIKDAVDYCSFDNMQRIEHDMSAKKPNKIGHLGAGDIEDLESYKVRRGKVGGYIDYLSPEDIQYLEKQITRLKGYSIYKAERDKNDRL